MKLPHRLLAAALIIVATPAFAQTSSPPGAATRAWKPVARSQNTPLVTIAMPRRAQPGELPVQVCSGVLISRQHVLTSATCVGVSNELTKAVDASGVEIYLGPRIDGASQPTAVARIIQHPDFDPATFRSDLAILTLEQPVPASVQPARLASAPPAPATPLIHTGWISDGTEQSIVFEMEVPAIRPDQCEAAVRDDLIEKTQTQYVDLIRSMRLPPDVAASSWRQMVGAMPAELARGMVCAAPEAGLPCDTDNAAPLLGRAGGVTQVFGILTSSSACEVPGMPGLYNSVAAHLPWIQAGIGDHANARPAVVASPKQRLLPAAMAAARLVATQQARAEPAGRNSPRIVGGVPAVPGTYPFQVSLVLAETAPGQEFQGFYCGGTRIGPRHILTAAHCMMAGQDKPLAAADVHVYLGHNGFRGGERIPVARIAVHPGWNQVTLVNDIAVLELERAPDAAAFSVEIGLMKPGNPYPERARAIGWGATDFQGAASRLLRETPMAVVSQAACDQNYRAFESKAVRTIIGEVAQLMGLPRTSEDKMVRAVTDGAEPRIGQSMICAGSLVGTRSTCQGDSGGPLFSTGADGKPMQIGVVSWGMACDTRNVYGVFTDVSKYADWIAGELR